MSRSLSRPADTGPERLTGGPVIVLVEPQMGENIGAAARAMANFGLSRLRIVNPRDGWPNERAIAAASRADHVLAAVEVFPDVPAATGDLRFVYATTARHRDLVKRVVGPDDAMRTIRQLEAEGSAAGILFGRERTGLTNEELALADEIVTLPVDPTFASLNVAQAVMVVAYEWRRSGDAPLPFAGAADAPPATKDELARLFGHLEDALDRTRFFRPPEKRDHMVQAIRAMLQRARFTDQEVRTFRGIIAALEDRPTRPPRDTSGRRVAKSPPGDGT